VREGVQPENGITNKSNDHQMGDILKRQCVVIAADSVLDSLDVTLDVRNMFILSAEVKNLA
jgi:hypothetical protein